jgi:dTDP-4-dehydrorhamnose reductase
LIHCAAYTAVDRAEQEEAAAYRANATACAVLAGQAAEEKAPMVLLSTDFVFDGKARRPYTEKDEPSPLSAYGRTKLAGEQAALEVFREGVRIVRTQWLYGPRGTHFPGTIVRLARERGKLRVVDDQVGSPTTTLELAPALWDVLDRAPAGIYHAACEGSCSWYELAAAVLAGVGLNHVVLEPCTSAEFPRPAQRPAYSVLDCSALGALRGRALLPWREALRAYLAVDPL